MQGMGLLEMMNQLKGVVHYGKAARGSLMPTDEAGSAVTDIAVGLLNGHGELLAGEETMGRDQPVKALPVISDEAAASVINPVDQLPVAGSATITQHPSERATRYAVNGAPEPDLVFFPFT